MNNLNYSLNSQVSKIVNNIKLKNSNTFSKYYFPHKYYTTRGINNKINIKEKSKELKLMIDYIEDNYTSMNINELTIFQVYINYYLLQINPNIIK